MRLRQRMISRTKYNILYMWFVVITTILLYYLLKQAAENVQAREFVSPIGRDPIVIEKEVIREVEVVAPCETEKCQIMAYIVERFGDDADDAITVLNKCENSEFNPLAANHNNNGTIDRGVFQINSVHGGEELFNWKTNVDKAYEIFSNGGWRQWSCSHVINIRSFWQ